MFSDSLEITFLKTNFYRLASICHQTGSDQEMFCDHSGSAADTRQWIAICFSLMLSTTWLQFYTCQRTRQTALLDVNPPTPTMPAFIAVRTLARMQPNLASKTETTFTKCERLTTLQNLWLQWKQEETVRERELNNTLFSFVSSDWPF